MLAKAHRLALFLVLIAPLAACGKGDGGKTDTKETPKAAPPPEDAKPEGALDILAWPGYIERGATDKSYDWVTEFEKQSGCKVNVKTAGSSDEMVALMNQGGIDLVTASGDAS